MLQRFSIFNTIFNDAPQPWQLGFQDSANMQRYLRLILNYTIFWNVLIANNSNLYILIELLEKN
jgi:cytochrome c oxidase subunit 2